jgi:hypothetical protein
MKFIRKIHGTARSLRVSAFACAIALTTCIPASATTLMRMSVAQMAQRAPLIVRVRCVANRTGWDAGEIWTFTTFDVLEVWRNASQQLIPGRIGVRLLGGTAGNLTSLVSGIPRFAPSEEAIVFLEPTPRGDYSVLSWQQGTFRIRRDAHSGIATVTQDTASTPTFDPVIRRFVIDGVRSRKLTAFHADVANALRSPAEVHP